LACLATPKMMAQTQACLQTLSSATMPVRLPEVYSGHPNRIERYNQYENMDMDSEINACLDIIAEFSTQMNEQNGTPFEVDYKDKPTDNEVSIIKNNCNSGSN
jgi:hypothetical protein